MVPPTTVDTDLTAGNGIIGAGTGAGTTPSATTSTTSGAFPWERAREDSGDLPEPTALSNGGNENGSRDDETLNSMIAEYFRK